jgi:hypothetical protein
VKKRNADYATILRKLAFKYQPSQHSFGLDDEEPAPSESASDRNASVAPSDISEPCPAGPSDMTADTMQLTAKIRSDAASMAFHHADLIIWMGDFNYRIDLDRCEAWSTHKRSAVKR